jgi:hypothetical protein
MMRLIFSLIARSSLFLIRRDSLQSIPQHPSQIV